MVRLFAASFRMAVLIFFVTGIAAAAASKPNLVLITIDSFRADRMGFLGARGNLTPNLNHLAEESIVFEHAYAQSPSTVISHATILTGTYPQKVGVSEIGGTLAATLPYLPELLKAQGYHTAAFVSSIDLDPWNGLAQGFDRGFETYDAVFRPVIPGDPRSPVTGRSAAETISRAVAWLGHNTREPFFLWVHIGDAHSTSYNAGVSAADAAIGKLLAALKDHPLKDQKIDGNCAVIIAGDYGQSLGAHGEETHGIFLYDETIHVPLIIKLPGAQSLTKRATAKARLLDIAPTMLGITGVSVPSQMQGQSLLRIAQSDGGDQPVYSRSEFPQRGFGWSMLESWRAGKYLYIRAPKSELYDIAADPGATRNLAPSSKATLDTMAAQLENFDRHFSPESGKLSSELSSTEMQKLASLGYVGLQQSAGHATAVGGIDPKDKIAIANEVVAAAPSVLAPAKPDHAIAALTPMVAADPNLYLAEYTLGVALAQKAQYAEAAKHLHRAIELQPDSSWAHYEIGATLVKTGDFKTAAVHLEIAVARMPAFGPAHEALAQAYDHLGRAEDAKKERAKAEWK